MHIPLILFLKRGLAFVLFATLAMSSYAESAPLDARQIKISVFVSFSMPDELLRETLQDSARLKIPAVLNGLHQNSMAATALKITELAREVPNLSLQIDPIAFERYSISQVPALVVESNGEFDVIYGTLPLDEGLSRIARASTSAFKNQEAREKTNG